MSKFLLRASFTTEGLKRVQQIKATGLRAIATKAAEVAGGKVEGYYFAFGADDIVGIADFPDAGAAASLSVAVNSAGLVRLTTTPLMTAEEMDRALEKAASLPVMGR